MEKPSYETFPLADQQQLLKYRIHYVRSNADSRDIIISRESIDHATAQLLYEYQTSILNYVEYERTWAQNNFIHHYYDYSSSKLFNFDYFNQQRKLAERLR